MDAYKVAQLRLMLAHEESQTEEHYGANLKHWHGDSKPIQIDAGGLRVLIDYYGAHTLDKTIEKRLASMKEEAVREISRLSNRDAKLAWYWSHIGAIDLARQLDLITDDRRQELYEEFRQYKPGKEAEE